MDRIDALRKRKTLIIIFSLVFSVSIAISKGAPLYIAMASVTLVAFILSDEKSGLLPHIIINLKAVSKTIILLLLISITLPLLMGCGALPTFIVLFSEMMIGFNVLMAAFIASTILSMILGTAIGTLTILIPLFVSLAYQIELPLPMLTGALLSGAYFGDRASPLASGLHLASSVTDTDYQGNIPILLKSSVIPYIISLIIFITIGSSYTIEASMLAQNQLIKQAFNINLFLISPLVLMILLLLLRLPINKVMTIIAIFASIILFQKGYALNNLIDYMLNGYNSTNATLSEMLKTTGVMSMLNVIFVIFFSACLNGILEANRLIEVIIDPFLRKCKSEATLIRSSAILGLILAMITCSQAMTSMVTGKYLKSKYDEMKVSRKLLVMSIGNVGLSLVGLIPWNVNGLVIRQLTGVSTLEYLPYSFFLIILSLTTIFVYPLWRPFKP